MLSEEQFKKLGIGDTIWGWYGLAEDIPVIFETKIVAYKYNYKTILINGEEHDISQEYSHAYYATYEKAVASLVGEMEAYINRTQARLAYCQEYINSLTQN